MRDPALVIEACQKFPGKVAVGIDAKGGKVTVEGWAEASELGVIELAQRFEDAGVAAIVFTDIGRDGLLNRVETADRHGIRVETTPTFWERFEDAFLRETIHFVDCVRHDREPGLSLHDATEATRIAIALRTSLVERREVDL